MRFHQKHGSFKFILFLLLFVACKLKDHAASQTTVNKYYDFLIDSKIDSVVNLFSSRVYNQIDTADFVDFLDTTRKTYGKIKSYKFIRSEATSRLDSKEGEYKTMEVTYQVVYSNGYVSKDQFLFFTEDGFSGKIDGFKTHKWKDDDN